MVYDRRDESQHILRRWSAIRSQSLAHASGYLHDEQSGFPPFRLTENPMRVSLVFALAACLASSAFADLTLEECRRLHQELTPSAQTAWRTIPWKIDLLEAQRAASREGKPIFIWAMDGHPLGCT